MDHTTLTFTYYLDAARYCRDTGTSYAEIKRMGLGLFVIERQ